MVTSPLYVPLLLLFTNLCQGSWNFCHLSARIYRAYVLMLRWCLIFRLLKITFWLFFLYCRFLNVIFILHCQWSINHINNIPLRFYCLSSFSSYCKSKQLFYITCLISFLFIADLSNTVVNNCVLIIANLSIFLCLQI